MVRAFDGVYPDTRRDDTVDVLHGQRIEDPYRWLEDPDSEETSAWVKAQNEVTRGHLDALPSRPWFHQVTTAIVTRPRAGTPDKVGGRYVVLRNDGTFEQDVLYVGDTLDELRDAPRVLLDPNTFSEDGTSSLFSRSASKDHALLAYLVSDGGSDWTSVHLLDLATGEPTGETLTNVKFSDATWLPDRSFLYVNYEVEGTGTGTDAQALPGGKLRRHRVGTPQSDDELVLEFPDNPRIGVTPELSHDGRWLVVHIHEGTSEKTRLWVYPVERDGDEVRLGEPLKIVDEVYAAFAFVRTAGDHLYVRTDHEAPLGKVVASTSRRSRTTGSSPRTSCPSRTRRSGTPRARATRSSPSTSSTRSRGSPATASTATSAGSSPSTAARSSSSTPRPATPRCSSGCRR
jgi:prolyl oligopeptidase